MVELGLEQARKEKEDPEAAQKIREYKEKMQSQKLAARAIVKKELKKQQQVPKKN